MKTLPQLPARTKHVVVHLGSIVMALLMVSFVPTAAHAAPPATTATCQGIKDAYPILGTQCENTYAKINHAPLTPADRLTSYAARKAVLEIFRQASICNGMFGATSQAQQSFKSGEPGHLTAIANLHVAMGSPATPAAYTVTDLDKVKINKPQCK